MGEEALEDLRWYLEDYLRAPFGVWEDRGPRVEARLAGWGEAVFTSVFGSGPRTMLTERAQSRGLELLFRSASPAAGVAVGADARSGWAGGAEAGRNEPCPAGRRPGPDGGYSRRTAAGTDGDQPPGGHRDIGYRMIARPLLDRLDAVRGEVDLVVLRPPTLDGLRSALAEAATAGTPFHVVHFDGHGALPRATRAGRPGARGEGVLVFEKPGGGSHEVAASKIAAVLKEAGVPVVILNACQSGAVGKDLEAAVATRLLQEGLLGGSGDGLQRLRGRGGRVHGDLLRAAVRRGHRQRGCDRRTQAPVRGRCTAQSRRATCRWRTGWFRCTTCAAMSAFPRRERAGLRASHRWRPSWTMLRARVAERDGGIGEPGSGRGVRRPR